MTRKQAVLEAIRLLKQHPASQENNVLCNKLQEVLNSMPFENWDKETKTDIDYNEIPMTRKQAVAEALRILKQQPASQENDILCDKLQEILEAAFFVYWDREAKTNINCTEITITRKQAVAEALRILKQQPASQENNVLCNKLQEALNATPFVSWDRETIIDIIDNWIIENGRLPTTRELNVKGFPSLSAIRSNFGMTTKQFLTKQYPKLSAKCNSNYYGSKTKEEWLRLFVEEYDRIQPHSAIQYNCERIKGSPRWLVIAQLNGVCKWSELLTLSNVKVPVFIKRFAYRDLDKLNVTAVLDCEEFVQSP